MHTSGNNITAQLVELTGPWDQAFLWAVPLEIRSKSNFRRHTKGGGSKGTRNNWKQFKDFEQLFKLSIRKALPDGWELGDATKPLNTRPAVVSFIFAESALDSANLPKSVLDACQTIVYHNDASVRHSSSLGVRARGGDVIKLAFARLPGSASERDLVTAATALQIACLPYIDGSVVEVAA